MKPKEFLARYGKQLRAREWHSSVNNNTQEAENWDKAELRVLFCFLSPGPTRSVASTSNAVNNILAVDYPECFIDFSYFPDKDDYELFKEAGAPYWFGASTGKEAREFDVILISQIIIGERFNMPRAMVSCNIPLGHNKRMKDETCPLVVTGGMAALYGESNHGPFEDEHGDQDECLVDIVYLGEAHRLPELLKFIKKERDEKQLKMHTIEGAVRQWDNIYYPMGYEVVYDGVKIVKNLRKYDWMPPFCYPSISKDMDKRYNFDRKIINLDGQAVSSADILISEGCSGGGSCTFCAEGWIMGGWRELPFNDIVEVMHSTRKWAATYQTSFFSFNNNYYSEYKRLLATASGIFPEVSMINMRADVVGAARDTIQLAKIMGANRASIAIEGVGPRIRNVFLNKNLPFELLFNAVKDCIQSRFMEVKFGMILTGRETNEDIDAAFEELSQIVKYRDDMGAKTQFRMNFTPAVAYDHTPLRSIKRITALNSLYGLKTMRYFLDRAKELHIRCKFNAREFGTFIEQMFLDGGRLITKDIVRFALSQDPWYSIWGNSKYADFVEAFKKYDIEALFAERPDNWIYPNHRIHTASHGGMLLSAIRWKNGESTPYCTKTPANLEPNCYAGQMKPSAIIEEADVDITIEGFLPTHFVDYKNPVIEYKPYLFSKDYKNFGSKWNDNILTYNGCSFCTSGEEKKSKTRREIDWQYPLDKVREAMANNVARQGYRVQFQKTQEYDFISPASVAHMVTSKILQTVEDYEPSYHSLSHTNGYWSQKGEGKAWWSGVCVWDVYNNEIYDIEKVRERIDEINSKLKIGKIINIYELIDHKEKVRLDDDNYFVFNCDLPVSRFESKIPIWSKEMKVYAKKMGVEVIETIIDRELDSPFVMSGGRGTIGAFRLPLRYNPYLYLGSILGIGMWKVIQSTDLSCIMIGKESMNICSQDNEHSLVDTGRNINLTFGKTVMLKKMLTLMKSRYSK